MAVITIGTTAVGTITNFPAGYTVINKQLSANGTGTITSMSFYFNTSDGSDVKAGTFYGSSTSWTNRDLESIGNITSGSKQTFTGLSCDVTTGDLLGSYCTSGARAESVLAGNGSLYKLGDQFTNGTQTYTSYNKDISMEGLGATIPTGIKWNGTTITKLNGVAVTKINGL